MKQTIEIEVPEGKKAIWENNQITFVDADPHWKSIKTFEDAYDYCYENNLDAYTTNYCLSTADTYEEKVAKLRLVIAALTNNEKVSLVSGKLYYPVIQFCLADFCVEDSCFKNKLIGKIKSEGKEYVVLNSCAHHCSDAGLGCVNSRSGLSNVDSYISFLQVSSKEVAEHLSKYFGKLIFEVMYGGSNCDWEWVE